MCMDKPTDLATEFFARSDLYECRHPEDCSVFYRLSWCVVAERANGSRFAHFFSVDTRDSVQDTPVRIARLLERMRKAGGVAVENSAHWRGTYARYGSAAYGREDSMRDCEREELDAES